MYYYEPRHEPMNTYNEYDNNERESTILTSVTGKETEVS
jgi:hypothetical protein